MVVPRERNWSPTEATNPKEDTMAMSGSPPVKAFSGRPVQAPGTILHPDETPPRIDTTPGVLVALPQNNLATVQADASANAERIEDIVSDLHGVINLYLGSEPPTEPDKSPTNMEPCLYGSLTSSNRRISDGLDHIANSMGRLRSSIDAR